MQQNGSLISMFKGEPVNVGGIDYIFTELPKFTLIYCDDLDAVGHNEASHYGYELVQLKKEEELIFKVC